MGGEVLSTDLRDFLPHAACTDDGVAASYNFSACGRTRARLGAWSLVDGVVSSQARGVDDRRVWVAK